MIKGAIQRYASSIVHHPLIVIALAVLFTVFAIYQASTIEEVGMSHRGMLPEGIEVIETFEIAGDKFTGSIASATIALETTPAYAGSDEVRDMRDPRALEYAGILSMRAEAINGVIDVSSAADVVKELNDGRIPNSLSEVKSLVEDDGQIGSYISEDSTMSRIELNLMDDLDENEIVADLEDVIRGPKPPGISVSLYGDAIMTVEMGKLVGPTMVTTSMISLISVLIIVVVLFRSIRYGLTPLATIFLGSIWAFAMFSLMGRDISPQTSGVLSMIIGIGIDFGIQVTTRFRYELRSLGVEEAMERTLSTVLIPMSTTTLAAIIGFRALSLGTLTMMAEIGDMMTLGVLFCMIAAVTIVPALLVLGEKGIFKKVFKRS